MTKIDKIKNECLTKNLGVMDITGKMRENILIDDLDMLKEKIMTR